MSGNADVHFIDYLVTFNRQANHMAYVINTSTGDLGPFFHKIVDLKLNPQQDKAALVLNLGRHPDAYTCLIKPVGLSLCFTGVMTDSISGTAADELEAVHTVQWMSDGQHVVYSRIGAAGTPAEVWLHHVGQPESSDRLLYEEVCSCNIFMAESSVQRRFVAMSCCAGFVS
jgi:protease II